MIKEGILENPKPDYALGVHVWNEKPLNWLGIYTRCGDGWRGFL